MLDAHAAEVHIINAPNDGSGLLVDDPAPGIIWVLLVTVGRRAHGDAGIALDLVADPAFFADVPGIPLVEHVFLKKGVSKTEKTQYSCGFAAGWLQLETARKM